MPRTAKPQPKTPTALTKSEVAKLAGVNDIEIFDYKEYPESVVVVTIMGQKFEVMKDAT